MNPDWGLVLVVVAATFLVAHLALDLRTLGRAVRHPNDLLWTLVTIAVLGAHVILDFVG